MRDFLQIIKQCIRDTYKNFVWQMTSFPIKTDSNELHLQEVMNWLDASIENGMGGSSSHYDLLNGKWLAPFPETTGYIITTYFDYYKHTGKQRYFDTAVSLTHWLKTVQLANGGCISGNFDSNKPKNEAIIFNTGQNLLGFVRAYIETQNADFLNAAQMAGDLLVNSTDENGIWNKNLLRGIKHTINTRSAWALLELNTIAPNPKYVNVAIANLNWAVAQQTDNGWFRFGTSRVGGLPNTHFISYTCEGLLESYRITDNKIYFDTALKTAEKLMKIYEVRKKLYAFWDENWKNKGRYFKNSGGKFMCQTGNAQISRVWMQIYEINQDVRFLNAAFKMLDFLKKLQNISSKNSGIRGAIAGSFPIYGGYSTLKYPNWAAKFFADSMITKIRLTK